MPRQESISDILEDLSGTAMDIETQYLEARRSDFLPHLEAIRKLIEAASEAESDDVEEEEYADDDSEEDSDEG
jgi:hypothetical protein